MTDAKRLATPPVATSTEMLQIRVVGDEKLPTLIYLPGVHGDWTLVGSFRAALSGKVRWVEFTYPRTLDWSLRDYADAIESALIARGITHGWLLGESFGSQVAWELLQKTMPPSTREDAQSASPETMECQPSMRWDGLILAGGFARHPMILTARLARVLWDMTPLPCLLMFLRFYLRFAKFRHRHAPETLSHMDEFASRRNALDRQALSHRLGLIAENDPRPIVEKTTLPVYYLSGWLDPVVPWPMVRAYLRRRCPGYRGDEVNWPADHNVLGTAPEAAARAVLRWMTTPSSNNST